MNAPYEEGYKRGTSLAVQAEFMDVQDARRDTDLVFHFVRNIRTFKTQLDISLRGLEEKSNQAWVFSRYEEYLIMSLGRRKGLLDLSIVVALIRFIEWMKSPS